MIKTMARILTIQPAPSSIDCGCFREFFALAIHKKVASITIRNETMEAITDNELARDDFQNCARSREMRKTSDEKEMKMKLNCQLWLLNKQTRYGK